MQRTVSFTMAIDAQMILDGRLTQRGIVEPSEVSFEPFIAELRKRGLKITQKIEPWDGSVEPGGGISLNAAIRSHCKCGMQPSTSDLRFP